MIFSEYKEQTNKNYDKSSSFRYNNLENTLQNPHLYQNNSNYSNDMNPIKLSSQMILKNDYFPNNNAKYISRNEPKNYNYSNTEKNLLKQNSNYNNDNSQSLNVEAERQNRLLYSQQKQMTENNRYNNYRSMDNKIYSDPDIYNRSRNNNYYSMDNIPYKNLKKSFNKPIPTSIQSQISSNYKNEGDKDEYYDKLKNNNSYSQKNSDVFRYEEVDDKCRHYSPYRKDYERSRFGSYIYNYYLNAPMRGDRSEDFKYPPQYYWRPKYDPVGKLYSNL